MNTTSNALKVFALVVLVLLGFLIGCDEELVPLKLISVDFTPIDAENELVDEDVTFTVEAEGSDLTSLSLYFINGKLEIGEEYNCMFTFYTNQADPTKSKASDISQKAEYLSKGLSVTYNSSKKTWEIAFEKGKEYYDTYFVGTEVTFGFTVKDKSGDEEPEYPIEWIFWFK